MDEALMIKKLFEFWNENDVKYAIWKGISKLNAVETGEEDLDVLLDIKSSLKAEMILSSIGFVKVENSWLKSDYGTSDYLYFTESGIWIHIHLHYNVIFGNSVTRNYRMPITKYLINNAVKNSAYGCKIISPFDDVALSILRYSSRKKSFFGYASLDKDLQNLQNHYIKTNELKLQLDNPYPNVLNDLIKKNNYKSSDIVNRNRKKITNSINVFKDNSNFQNLVYVYRLFSLIKEKIIMRASNQRGNKKLMNKGLKIAFVGIDGSGKSSAIERLSRKLKKQLSTTTISVGSGVSGASWYRRLIFNVYGNKAKSPSHIKNRKEKSKDKKYPLLYSLWLLLCLFDKKNQLQRGISKANQGEIVIIDRWLQEEVDDFIDSPRVPKESAKTLITRFLYRKEREVYKLAKANPPEIIIIMEVNAENSTKRKPNDLTYDQAFYLGEKIKDLKWNGSTVFTINANNSIEEVDLEINKILSKEMSH
ncbi:hypothetical protein [Vibrio sp. 1F255]|uniref:hypothetical protein n=1 Tax=Vibrio sp. 1F255 TaxID=3230009 RepID=UPI00352C20D7